MLGPPDPIQSAIALEDLDKLEQATKVRDVNARLPGGDTALHYACGLAKVKAVRALLELGADPAVKNAAGRTPWDEMWFRRQGGRFTERESETLALLVEFGCRPTEPVGSESQTLLHQVAAHTQSSELIRRLVEGAGQDVAAVDDYGWTPLHAAANGRNAEGCKALIELGADVQAETTQTKENEALKEYRRLLEINRGINAGDGIPLATEQVNNLPGSIYHKYYRYEAGSRPLDVTSITRRRMEPDLRKLLASYGATSNEHVQNEIEDDNIGASR